MIQPCISPSDNWTDQCISDIADGLVGVGLITSSEDCPGVLTLDKGYNEMSKFLNRILGMHVQKQNLLFKYFSDTLNAIIQGAKRSGRYDQGILDVGTTLEDHVELARTHTFLRKHATGKAKIELHVLQVERGQLLSSLLSPSLTMSLYVRNELGASSREGERVRLHRVGGVLAESPGEEREEDRHPGHHGRAGQEEQEDEGGREAVFCLPAKHGPAGQTGSPGRVEEEVQEGLQGGVRGPLEQAVRQQCQDLLPRFLEGKLQEPNPGHGVRDWTEEEVVQCPDR